MRKRMMREGPNHGAPCTLSIMRHLGILVRELARVRFQKFLGVEWFCLD